MRIISGSCRGKRLKAPTNQEIRPTSDRVREAVGAILQARRAIAGARILELFSGSGAMSFELLSRGAKNAVLCDLSPEANRLAKENARILGLEKRSTPHRIDLLKSPEVVIEKLSSQFDSFDLVVADPPYRVSEQSGNLVREICDSTLIDPGGWVIFECEKQSAPTLGQSEESCYNYGTTKIVLCRVPTTKLDNDEV